MKGSVCMFSFLWWLAETGIRGGRLAEGHHTAHRENRSETRKRGSIFNSP